MLRRHGSIGLVLLAAVVGQGTRAGATPPDLVLVTIDTLRADAVGFLGRSPSPTPLLDRLAAGGRVFPDAHAHNVVTLPSHVNLLTGLYPYQHGVRDNSGFALAATIPTLATLLHDAGWATGAFVAAFPLDSQHGLARGFEVYDDRYPKGTRPEELAMPERRGDAVVDAALGWWTKPEPRPRFLWVHLYDPHAPYSPPEPFASRFRSAPYLGEVAAADAFLAPLLEPLLAGRGRPALVVVTADHGEALGDHGETTHGLFAYEATLRVPLVLWGAGVMPGRDSRPARHVDVFPTLLAAAGVAPPPAPRPGRSLLAPVASEAAPGLYFEALSTTLNRGWAPLRGLIRAGRKAIELPLPELYDLAADPAEATNLVDSERRSYRELLALLPAESAWPPARDAPGGEEAGRLLALGYVAGDAVAAARYGPEDDPKRLRGLDRAIFRIVELYQRGRPGEAAEAARAVVAARPAMAIGHSLLAQALLEAGRRDDALAAMQAAKRAGVAGEGLLLQLGLTLAEAGRADEAVTVLEPLRPGGSSRVLAALGLALADSGRVAEGRATLERAVSADPENPTPRLHLAVLALRAGRFAEARDAARSAVELDPGLALGWNDLGVALFQTGDRGGAVDAWERAVALDPRLWDAQWNLGLQAGALGRTATATRALRAFVEGAPRERYGEDVERARLLLEKLGTGG